MIAILDAIRQGVNIVTALCDGLHRSSCPAHMQAWRGAVKAAALAAAVIMPCPSPSCILVSYQLSALLSHPS